MLLSCYSRTLIFASLLSTMNFKMLTLSPVSSLNPLSFDRVAVDFEGNINVFVLYIPGDFSGVSLHHLRTLFYTLNCILLKIRMFKFYSAIPQDVTAFGDKVPTKL